MKNRDKVKVHTLFSEAHVEHAFARNFQDQANEHAEMNEYLYSKRKIEIERVIKIFDTPFFFEERKKDYAAAPDSASGVDVFAMLELISDPAKPVRENKESILKADKEVVRIA